MTENTTETTNDALSFLSDEARKALHVVSTATLTTQLFSRGLLNTFIEGPAAINKNRMRLVGVARTMRCIPSREDLDPLSVFQDYDHPQRKAVESVEPGEVLVIDARGKTRVASMGHILGTRVKMRGGAGVVTDGSVRDAVGFEELDLPVFASGASPTTNLALHHVVEQQVPIGCGEVPVYPGDVMVGDRDGVVCIPRDIAEEVALAAADQEDLEEFILKIIESGEPLRNNYPASPEVLARYQAQRGR